MRDPADIQAELDKTARDLLARTVPQADDRPRWVGYCAPGRGAIAWISMVGRPERVVAIHETATLTGQDIILVNVDAMPGYMTDLLVRP